VSKGVPFYGRFEAKNYASMLTGEQRYDVDTSDVEVKILPGLFTTLIPGFGPDKTAIFVGAFKDGGHGACDALDGMRDRVLGHPEAIVTYYTKDAVPVPTSLDATTESGRAAITGLAVGEPVTLTGAKPGCEVVFVHGTSTGRAPLEAGFVTF